MPIQDVQDRTLNNLLSLEGRVAVVTGGARGIGYAISRRLAEAGAAVLVSDLDTADAEEAAQSIRKDGFGATGLVADATDSASLASLAERALSDEGRLDIWVNNAGIFPPSFLTEMTDERWQRVLRLNLDGVFYGSREAAERMKTTGNGGVIVNTASTNSYRGAPGLSHYVASKFGVRGLTQSLAAELAPEGIRVVAVAPALMDTEGLAEREEELRPVFGGADPKEAFERMLPLGRVGVPDDVARVVAFLASDLATFVTGSTVPIDGGLLAV